MPVAALICAADPRLRAVCVCMFFFSRTFLFTAQTSPFLLACSFLHEWRKSSAGKVAQSTEHWTEKQCAQHRMAEHHCKRAWVGRNPSPPMRQNTEEFHRQVEIGDGRRENRSCRKCYLLLQPDRYRRRAFPLRLGQKHYGSGS